MQPKNVAIGEIAVLAPWPLLKLRFPGSQTQFGNPPPETPFHVKIATIFENLNQFGTPFQKVFCHSANSQTPLAEYFSSCKALKSNYLRRPIKVFCHSAKAQRRPIKQEW
jgi:hypothetical protein